MGRRIIGTCPRTANLDQLRCCKALFATNFLPRPLVDGSLVPGPGHRSATLLMTASVEVRYAA